MNEAPIIRRKEEEEWIEWKDLMIEISIDPMDTAHDGWLMFDMWDAAPWADGEWLGQGFITTEDWEKNGTQALRPYAAEKRRIMTIDDETEGQDQ